VINTGTLESTGLAGLTLQDDVTNSGGQISVAALGSLVDLDGITVTGGKFIIVAGAMAEATGGADSLDGMTITDKGVLEATHDSTMTLSDTTVNATGGTVEASDAITLSAAAILLSDATINGGTLTTSDGGVIETVAGTDSTLSGVTMSAGTAVTVTDDSTLTLEKTITSAGTIALDSTGDATLLAISGNVSLQGGGNITLSDDSNNAILSDGSTAKFTNVDNTISGAGLIGDGDTTLTFVNKDVIDATGTHPPILNTGTNTISNPGTLQVDHGATLIVDSPIIKSTTGAAEINDGTLEFGASSNVPVSFSASGSSGSGSAGYTFITLDDPSAAPVGGTNATGINNAGQILGYYTQGSHNIRQSDQRC
jgi:hypothetical protein